MAVEGKIVSIGRLKARKEPDLAEQSLFRQLRRPESR